MYDVVRAEWSCGCVFLPEFVLERVLCANVSLSFPSWSPAACQVLGVPGPAGQIDRLLWRHWDKKKRGADRRKIVGVIEGTKLSPAITLASFTH